MGRMQVVWSEPSAELLPLPRCPGTDPAPAVGGWVHRLSPHRFFLICPPAPEIRGVSQLLHFPLFLWIIFRFFTGSVVKEQQRDRARNALWCVLEIHRWQRWFAFLLLLLSLNVNIFKTYMVRITRGNTFMAKTKKNTVKEKRHPQLNQCERQCS